MDNMTTEEQISAIQTERNDARQDLRDTLTDVNEKVGASKARCVPITSSRAIPSEPR